MADPICRWRNVTIGTLRTFLVLLPKVKMDKAEARDFINAGADAVNMGSFFTTPYQAAKQQALFYEDNNCYYPRFEKPLTEEQAKSYLRKWLSLYYIPNPYTKRGFQNITQPKLLLNNIFQCLNDSNGKKNWEEVKAEIFEETTGNDDILKNVIKEFCDELCFEGTFIKYSDDSSFKQLKGDQSLTVPYDRDDAKAFFEHFGASKYALSQEVSVPQDAKKNLIYFGAPGTGKSHQLKKDSEVFGKNIERVTFYPNYSYAQFVGTYKPIMKPKNDASGDEEITYAYVPGPFIRQWIKAKATGEPVLLIIEELNRANAAAVFGDMFQLLDRKNGESEYPVATSEDLRKYLKSRIAPASASEEEIKQNEYLPNDTNVDEISIPNNMYIWTTMNSADQGVVPLDTAFKRRWDYKYFSVFDRKEYGEDNIDAKTVILHGKEYKWGVVREKINEFLVKKNVNEDKLIGPYFISETFFADAAQFVDAFCNKIIMYLFEDAARQYRKDTFQLKDSKLPLVYSQICKQFKESGFLIFKFDIPAENQETTTVEGSNE